MFETWSAKFYNLKVCLSEKELNHKFRLQQVLLKLSY